MKHSWIKDKKPNVCKNCGLVRTTKTFKLLMAISNKKPYNHYKYESKVIYKSGEMIIYKAPPCLGINIYINAVVDELFITAGGAIHGE
jgi:hypothetical protein